MTYSKCDRDRACGVQVQVTVLDTPVKGSEPVQGETRPVYYHYHYHRNFERHVTEKQPGNICAFCLQRCSSFKVPTPDPLTCPWEPGCPDRRQLSSYVATARCSAYSRKQSIQ